MQTRFDSSRPQLVSSLHQIAETRPDAPSTTLGTQPGFAPNGPKNAAIGFDRRLPRDLRPLGQAMAAHWGFLYERAEQGTNEFTAKRTQLNGEGVAAALEQLAARGHKGGTGKVIVFGGGYEVDLRPLLERFAEVHVVDLCEAPLQLIDRKNFGPRARRKLRLVTADVSGVPVKLQSNELARMLGEVAASGNINHDAAAAYFARIPERLRPLPFADGAFDLVISPVLHESLPYAPLTAAIEAVRARKGVESGEPQPRQPLDEVMGEKFYYRPEVRQAFARTSAHHQRELQRLLKDDGVAVFGSWMRLDEHQERLAPESSGTPLVRVGDTRMSHDEYEALLQGWADARVVRSEQVYPGKLPTMNVYVLTPQPTEPVAGVVRNVRNLQGEI